jgi:energy-coupling factor transport system substrate-specific component
MSHTPVTTRSSRLLNAAILSLVSAIGIAAFLYPFVQPAAEAATSSETMAHARDAPLLFAVVIVLCLGAVLGNLVGSGLHAKMIAALGVLTAANAVLRAVPGPAGFSAAFALPILVGYCYGPTFGYLLGALSIAVSAMMGAGVGPWLPYQMFTTGWMGLTSAWLPHAPRRPKLEVAMLVIWAVVWGMLFGFVMNIWFWPYIVDPAQASSGQTGMHWEPGMGALQAFRSYLAFYALTSSWWDVARAAGNGLIILAFGQPLLRLLRRFGRRFTFTLEESQ